MSSEGAILGSSSCLWLTVDAANFVASCSCFWLRAEAANFVVSWWLNVEAANLLASCPYCLWWADWF
jgi:hypothetical protein